MSGLQSLLTQLDGLGEGAQVTAERSTKLWLELEKQRTRFERVLDYPPPKPEERKSLEGGEHWHAAQRPRH
jgi:AAA+ superfamily predicted ATPase